jgi:hypothetical protein
MKKIFLFYACILLGVSSPAQTNGNPGAHLLWLRSHQIGKDPYKTDRDFIQIKKHDTIADIGTYDGYYPLMYSIFSDSAVFYLTDITSEGFSYFDTMYDICSGLRGSPFTNQFKLIIGSDSSTNLPRHLFTKVILQDALHHFKMMDKMLSDIREIMSPGPGARLLLYETVRGSANDTKLCRGAMTREDLIALLDRNGFQLVRELRRTESLSWFEFEIRK